MSAGAAIVVDAAVAKATRAASRREETQRVRRVFRKTETEAEQN